MQTAAIVLEKRSPSRPEEWRDCLSSVGEAGESAWDLTSDDVGQAAFMQPPTEYETTEEFIESGTSKDHFKDDVPFIQKSHDNKAFRNRDPRPDHLAYSLTNVQMTTNYQGGGNYGTIKTGGGFNPRPMVALRKSAGWGWVMEEAEFLAGRAEDLDENLAFEYSREDSPLTWTHGADERLPVQDQHPLFLDCPRTYRWLSGHGLWGDTTGGTKIVPADDNQRTGDCWTPLDGSEPLRPNQSHFEYRELYELLFTAEYTRPFSFRKDASEGNVLLTAVLRGQGKTPRLCRRVIPFSTESTGHPFGPNTPVADEAQRRIEIARNLDGLLSAVDDILGTEIETGDGKSNKSPAANYFHEKVDDRFFDRLFEAGTTEEEELREYWSRAVGGIADEAYRRSRQNMPRAGEESSKWKRLGEADYEYKWGLRSHLPHLG
ncbi:hypothetical protein [Salinibacter grassmerensis]|uniref:hypothetical protein n=1 Tax=Salinibacter grassmerensis TaxID=3040353 RepID=UPI0021E857BE|nr:hypothetical protein [Salinibacter grassmerensis]